MSDLASELRQQQQELWELHQRLLQQQYLNAKRWDEWIIRMNQLARPPCKA